MFVIESGVLKKYIAPMPYESHVVIPQEVTRIGSLAFSGDKTVLSIELPYGVTEIENGAFMNTALREIEIPDSVISIGSNAFANTRLKYVHIPASVQRIGENAFFWCGGLRGVAAPPHLSTEELLAAGIPKDAIVRY